MKGLLRRNIYDFALEALEAFPALVIQGPRQAGKSTIAAQITSGRSAHIATLDSPQTLAAARSQPVDFIDQHPGGTLVIDELQRAPELILPLKAAIDRDRRPGRFVLTGSSDLLSLAQTPDSLAGRTVTIRVFPFSQGELQGQSEDFASRIGALTTEQTVTSTWARTDYAQAVARGGYAPVAALSAKLRGSWFDSYIDSIVRRDLADISPRTQSARVGKVLRLLAAGQAGEFARARVARDADLPESTVSAYLNLLETTFLVHRLPAWTANLTSREARRPKVVIIDPGLALRLAGLTPEQLIPLSGGPLLGPMLEGLVITELIKQQTWSAQEFRILHFRDRTGLEVDAVLEFFDGTVIGIEVKSSSAAKAEHFGGLRVLRDRLGSKFLGGFVLNISQAGMRFADKLWTLPVSALWENQGLGDAKVDEQRFVERG